MIRITLTIGDDKPSSIPPRVFTITTPPRPFSIGRNESTHWTQPKTAEQQKESLKGDISMLEFSDPSDIVDEGTEFGYKPLYFTISPLGIIMEYCFPPNNKVNWCNLPVDKPVCSLVQDDSPQSKFGWKFIFSPKYERQGYTAKSYNNGTKVVITTDPEIHILKGTIAQSTRPIIRFKNYPEENQNIPVALEMEIL